MKLAELPSLSTSLLQQVQQMNSAAWVRIVDVFGPIVYRWARKSGLAAEDAADIVQDVLASVARNPTQEMLFSLTPTRGFPCPDPAPFELVREIW